MWHKTLFLLFLVVFESKALNCHDNHLISNYSKIYHTQDLNISKAQTREDIFLFNYFFYHKYNGKILESGSLDGLRFSSTYMLTHLFNWTAIHIEGHEFVHFLLFFFVIFVLLTSFSSLSRFVG